ncbi:josephin-like protein [Impatiens glandulifera]|uniref:josephin-like protein n=1 Tax=Impatiens glandulifera TaxID=253017 RepID=UPI001FB05C1C|nr:josephin-like protein [Impatiens glandulifera]
MEGIERREIYHERQRLQFCLLHSLNNLFQDKNAFTREELNAIAERLVLNDPNTFSISGSWKTPLSVILKPHYNPLTGNYDINVLITALEGMGKSVVWHDRRNKAASIDLDDPEGRLMGIVVNIAVRKFGGLWKSRHWFAIKKIDGFWYNLDSDLSMPLMFRDIVEVREFLDAMIAAGSEVLLIVN